MYALVMDGCDSVDIAEHSDNFIPTGDYILKAIMR